MRCSHCGFPLAPKRTSCPKCGTTTTGESEGRSSSQNQAPISPQASFGPAGTQNSSEQQVWGAYAPAMPLNGPGMQRPSFGQQIPFAASQPTYGPKDMPAGSPPPLYTPPMQTPSAPESGMGQQCSSEYTSPNS